jgi:UDP-N-acetylglucosamine--N-acetylmuramyl-(pentapeptide) pyrophosphoryl-undecaprenol N-acetylglucosamine transferase
MLVASSGGHLAELHRLESQVAEGATHVTWATFDTPQSRSLLRGRQVAVVRQVDSRGYGSLVRVLPRALRLLREHRPERVVSTGSGIALAFLPFAPLVGAEAVYIESAARTSAPSLTGRLLSGVPWVRVYTQYAGNVSRRWKAGYSVFDAWRPAEGPAMVLHGPPRVLVLLGTLHFGFQRLLDRIVETLPPGADIVWQLGTTETTRRLPGRVETLLPSAELESLARDRTMVISHAGVGSALLALQSGVSPVLVPRRHAFGEHVDDHQVEIARELEGRGLAKMVEPEDISHELYEYDYRNQVISRP